MNTKISELAKKCSEIDYISLRVKSAVKELEDFDKLILQIIYQNALDVNAVDKCGVLSSITSQAYSYTELADCIQQHVSIKHSTIYISLNILEKLGLIIQVSVGYPQYRYAISALGIEVIKHI